MSGAPVAMEIGVAHITGEHFSTLGPARFDSTQLNSAPLRERLNSAPSSLICLIISLQLSLFLSLLGELVASLGDLQRAAWPPCLAKQSFS